jgi:tripartite-type tricarboxylate transporter receptor subunit TctC
VPTFSESGFPGFKTLTWNGIVAPTGTPPSIINRVAAAVQDAVCKPEFRARLWQLGVDPIGDTPAQFSQTLRADIITWAEAAKASNLKID